MVLSEAILTLPEVSGNILDLILILKALSVAAVLYFVYVVLMGVFTYRRMRKVESIEEKADAIEKRVRSIDKKLNKLLREKS